MYKKIIYKMETKLKSKPCEYCQRKFTPKNWYEDHHKKCWDKVKLPFSKSLKHIEFNLYRNN